MAQDYSSRLKGTLEQVLATASSIQTEMTQAKRGGIRCKFKFGLQVLRGICVVLQSPELPAQNMDIYYMIIEQTLLPNMHACAEIETYWEQFLGCLRFLHYQIRVHNNIEIYNRIYALFKTQCYPLLAETNYKCLLDIHTKHLTYQHPHQQQQLRDTQSTSDAEKQAEAALLGLSDLFAAMLSYQRSTKCSWPELLLELNRTLLGKRSNTFYRFLNKLPKQASSEMFKTLFELLSVNVLSASELMTHSQDYLNAFFALLCIDAQDTGLQQQNALDYLRICRERFKVDTLNALCHFYQLLYYLVKLIYSRAKVPEFKPTYLQLGQKCIQYLERTSAAHAQEQWFHDFLVVLQHLLLMLHASWPSGTFAVFWSQMDGDDALYVAHLNLISCCMKLSARINGSVLMSACDNGNCTSVRKHVILSQGTCALTAYGAYMQQQQKQQQQQQQKEQEERQVCEELQKISSYIVRYTISVVDSMQCATEKSPNLRHFVRRLLDIGDHAKTAAHAAYFAQLMPLLCKIRGKLLTYDWQMLMRRLYKTTALHDANQVHNMHSLYIATLLSSPMVLRMELMVFYQSTRNAEQSISELLENCISALRAELSETQKRLLYNEEVNLVLHLTKKPTIMRSLLRCSRTTYDFARVARYLRNEEDVCQRLSELCVTYRRTTTGLRAIEQLVYAFALTSELLLLSDAQKVKIDISDVNDSDLEEFLLKQTLTRVDSETKKVSLALDALRAFETFFKQSFTTPLLPEDVHIQIDWVAIIDDLTTVANCLQLMGYMAETNNAWLLLYEITSTINERYNFLRTVSYFFAHSAQLQHDPCIDLDLAASKAQRIIGELLPEWSANKLFKRHQTFVLLCLCQMANYYAICNRLRYAHMLLAQVEQLHAELSERSGEVDIILLTMYSVRFRLICQLKYMHAANSNAATTTTTKATTTSCMSLNVLRLMDLLLGKFRSYKSFSSVDYMACMQLSIEFVQHCIECSANRIGERISLFSTVLNMTLQGGLALRTIQILIAQLWSHLQMESVDKAQSVLRLIEHFYCSDVRKQYTRRHHVLSSKQHLSSPSEDLEERMLSLQISPSYVEPIRRQCSKQLQPELSPNGCAIVNNSQHQARLQSYLEPGPMELQNNKQLQWTYYTVGCYTARLHYLLKDYEQLGEYYEQADGWFQRNRLAQSHLSHVYEYTQLLNSGYYVNYMRATKCYRQAVTYLNTLLEDIRHFEHVDINFRYNLTLQLKSVQLEQTTRPKVKSPQIRRVLQFNISPEEPTMATTIPKRPTTQDTLATVKARSKAIPKLQSIQAITYSSGENSSSPDADHPTFDPNACQLIDTIDLDDSSSSNSNSNNCTDICSDDNKTAKTMARPTTAPLTAIDLNGDVLARRTTKNGKRMAKQTYGHQLDVVATQVSNRRQKIVSKLSADVLTPLGPRAAAAAARLPNSNVPPPLTPNANHEAVTAQRVTRRRLRHVASEF